MPDVIPLEGQRQHSQGEPAAATLGETRKLCYELNGKRLIDGVDVKIANDGVTMLMGPNGAGKSLLLRLLHGLITPSAGDVLWHGRPIDERGRREQAMVFQRPILLRRSVAANIRFALKLRGRVARGEVETILDEVGLGARAEQPARLLSGGEQQRLSLARALATRPRVLFLDEPTASLDPASTAAIETIVTRASERGTKILFVTHDIGQAHRLADDVVFLNHGRLAEHTPAKTFFDNPASPAAADYLDGRLVLR